MVGRPAAESRHLAQLVNAIGQTFRKSRQGQRISAFAQAQHGGGQAGFAGQEAYFPFLGAKAAGFQIGEASQKAL